MLSKAPVEVVDSYKSLAERTAALPAELAYAPLRRRCHRSPKTRSRRFDRGIDQYIRRLS